MDNRLLHGQTLAARLVDVKDKVSPWNSVSIDQEDIFLKKFQAYQVPDIVSFIGAECQPRYRAFTQKFYYRVDIPQSVNILQKYIASKIILAW